MPTIRISDESMQRLKAWAEPLVDSADSALAKALDAAERYRETPGPTEPGPVSRSGPRGKPSPELPEGEFREPSSKSSMSGAVAPGGAIYTRL